MPNTVARQKKLQILIVDDNEMDNELYRYFLQHDATYPYQISAAYTASDARAFLQQHTPDCIILDYHLPDTEGFGFLTELAQDDRYCIVMLTGDMERGLAIRALKLGAAEYLEKSECSPSTFARTVRYAIERHRARQEFLRVSREMDKQKEMNTLQHEFSAIASHEIRSSIASIHMAIALIEKRQSPDVEACSPYLVRIRESCGRIINLVDNTLKLSEIEHRGKIDYQPIRFSLKKMMEKLLEHYTELYQDRIFRYDLTQMPEDFRGDPMLCEQVFSNLLSNAVKYTPEGRSIEIGSAPTGTESFEVYVKDEGIGIPQENLDKLFSKFYRADNARGIGGSGLGLHLAKMLVEEHKGSIGVSSEPGKGTTFVVKLPRTQPRAA